MIPTRGLPVLVLTLAAIGGARPALALPITFQVDAGATSLAISVSSTAGGSVAPLDLAGAVTGDVLVFDHPSFGPVATQLELTGGSVSASHPPLSIAAAGISLALSSSDLGLSLSGPPVGATPVAPGFSVADFRNQVASLEAGSLSILGSVLADSIDVSRDLSAFPIALILPLNSIGQIRLGEPTPGSTQLDVSIPVDVVAHLFASDLVIDLAVTGDLALTGTIVPEPSTLLLWAASLAVACAAGRRRTAR